MAHYNLVRQENLVGHNLDGTEQETGEYYVLLRDGVPVFEHEQFLPVLEELQASLSMKDTVTISVPPGEV